MCNRGGEEGGWPSSKNTFVTVGREKNEVLLAAD